MSCLFTLFIASFAVQRFLSLIGPSLDHRDWGSIKPYFFFFPIPILLGIQMRFRGKTKVGHICFYFHYSGGWISLLKSGNFVQEKNSFRVHLKEYTVLEKYKVLHKSQLCYLIWDEYRVTSLFVGSQASSVLTVWHLTK